MGKLSDAKTLISLFGVGFILITALSMIGCATTPVDYKKSQADHALTAQSKSIVDYELTASDYYKKGQYDEAIKNAKQGVALNPSHAPNWYWLGASYYMRGQYDEAIQPFQKVIELKLEVLIQSSYFPLVYLKRRGAPRRTLTILGIIIDFNVIVKKTKYETAILGEARIILK